MLEVYKGREEEIMKKSKTINFSVLITRVHIGELAEQRYLEKEAEKEQVTRDINAYEEEALQKKLKQFEVLSSLVPTLNEIMQINKEHQTAIVTQAREKAELKKKMLMDKLAEELHEIEDQLQYLQWVKKEKEEARRAVNDLFLLRTNFFSWRN